MNRAVYFRNLSIFLIGLLATGSLAFADYGTANSTRSTRAVQPGTDNIIELGLWGAPDLFKFFEDELGSRAAADAYITTYFEGIARDLDSIFNTITTTKIRVYLLGSGYDRNNGNAPWIANNIVDDSGTDVLEASGALSDFVSRIDQAQTDLGVTFDHAVGLTRYDIQSTIGEDQDDTISVSDVDTMCTGTSVSIAEVSQKYFLKGIAQGIALSMGITYASKRRLFIMNIDLTSVPTLSEAEEPWTFFSTNEDEAKTYIDNLGVNCLLTQDAGFNFDTFLALDPYGAAFTNDQMCFNVYGSGSTACESTPTDVCYAGLACTVSSVCTGLVWVGQRTPCDTGLLCDLGTCSFDRYTTSTSSTVTTAGASTEPALQSSTVQPMTSTTMQIPDDPCCCRDRKMGKIFLDLKLLPCGRDIPIP